MSNMRLCFVSDTYPTLPRAAGLALYTRTAARALAARGHEVHVLVGQRKEFRNFDDGQVHVHIRPVCWLPLLARWLPGLGESFCLAWALWRLQRRHRFDMVEFPNWEGMGFISALLRVSPIVMRMHTMTLESLRIAGNPLRTGDKFTLFMERACFRLSRANVTHSRAHREWLRSNFGLNDVTVIPHGIDLPETKNEVSNDALVVLCVGSFSPRKDVGTLLKAIPLVLEKVPEVEFWLVGGSENSAYETSFRAEHPQITPSKVRFWGYIADDKIQNFYNRCTVYTSPSLYESFGLTFVEAMAHAKPVVGCAVSAMLDTIEHERTGLLVPPRDPPALAAALIRLLRDLSLRQQFGVAGQKRVHTDFSARRMAADLDSFYAQAANRSPK